MDEVGELLGGLLAGEETVSEIGRVRAYRKCVRYAEERLAMSHLCNLFLYRAAEQLGQSPMAVPVVHNRVPLPQDARLWLNFNEDEGPVLVGNAEGLQYLGSLCTELAQALVPGENVVLDEGYPPFVGDSYGLTLYWENEEWFAAAEEGVEDEFVAQWEAELDGRILSSEAIVALQLCGPVPGSLALSPQKLYKVHSLDPWAEGQDVPRKPFRPELDRVRTIALVDDDNQPLRIAVDLDDPDLTFYYDWHLEQFAKS